MFEELLARLARELGAAQIPYMVIGGQAVQIYGEPRMTKDIDITLGVGIDEVDRVLAMCRSAGLRPLTADAKQFARDTMVVPTEDQSSGVRVDFILSFSEYERQALDRAAEILIGSTPVRFATLEDLVVHKLVAGRPRDVEDARMVLAKNPRFDQAYIEHWLESFDRALSRNTVVTFRGLLSNVATRRHDDR